MAAGTLFQIWVGIGAVVVVFAIGLGVYFWPGLMRRLSEAKSRRRS